MNKNDVRMKRKRENISYAPQSHFPPLVYRLILIFNSTVIVIDVTIAIVIALRWTNE